MRVLEHCLLIVAVAVVSVSRVVTVATPAEAQAAAAAAKTPDKLTPDYVVQEITKEIQKAVARSKDDQVALRRLLNAFQQPLVAPADSAALGATIFSANPYQACIPVIVYPPPFPSFDCQLLSHAYFINLSQLEMHERPGNWVFKGVPHYIQRAIRVPYTFYRKSENGSFYLVTDYFVVGFEGGGAY